MAAEIVRRINTVSDGAYAPQLKSANTYSMFSIETAHNWTRGGSSFSGAGPNGNPDVNTCRVRAYSTPDGGGKALCGTFDGFGNWPSWRSFVNFLDSYSAATGITNIAVYEWMFIPKAWLGPEPMPGQPSPQPSPKPSPRPSLKPSPRPFPQPSPLPSPKASPRPSPKPSPRPFPQPSPLPSPKPSPKPFPQPSPRLSPRPSPRPSPKSSYQSSPTNLSSLSSSCRIPNGSIAPRAVHRGMYVSLTSSGVLGYSILGNRTAENQFLAFLIHQQIDSISLYDLNKVLNLDAMPEGQSNLASFMDAARACGVVEINAVGASKAREYAIYHL